MLIHVLSILSIAIYGLSSAGPQLPVTTCKRDLVDNSACLKRALKKAWPQFIAGLPEFDFPSLDPFAFKYGKFTHDVIRGDHHNEDVIRGDIILSNVTALGLSKTRFTDVRTHFLDGIFRLEVDTTVPNIFLSGAVETNAMLNVFRLDTKGSFNLTAEDLIGTWSFTGPVINDTWSVEHFLYSPSIGKVKVGYDSLLEESKEFYNLVVSFINEYWPLIYRVILPSLYETWDPWVVNIANKFFSKVSFSVIFP